MDQIALMHLVDHCVAFKWGLLGLSLQYCACARHHSLAIRPLMKFCQPNSCWISTATDSISAVASVGRHGGVLLVSLHHCATLFGLQWSRHVCNGTGAAKSPCWYSKQGKT
eukprot:7026633-Ditylum_brightwellii.AAC.1